MADLELHERRPDLPTNQRSDARAKVFRRRRLVGTWLITLILVGGAITMALHVVDLSRSVELARHANPAWLLAALGAQTMTYLVVALVWWSALARAGSRRRFGGLLRLAVVRLFCDQAVPSSGLSGTLVVTRALAGQGIGWRVVMGAMLFGAIAAYGADLVAIHSALAVLWLEHQVRPIYIWLAALGSCVAIGIPVLLLFARRWASSRRVRMIGRWLGLDEIIPALAHAPTDLLRRPRLVLGGVGAQLCVFLLDSLTLVIVFRAIGQHVGLEVAFPALVFATIGVTVAPIPTSLGTFEAACVAVLVSLGVSAEASLTATLLLRALTFWLPMIPGSIMLRRELRASRARPPSLNSGLAA